MSDQIDLEERNVGKEKGNEVEEAETYAKLSLGIKGSDSKCHKVLGQVWDNLKDKFKFEVSSRRKGKNVVANKEKFVECLSQSV